MTAPEHTVTKRRPAERRRRRAMQLALVACASAAIAAAVASASSPPSSGFHARPLARAFAVLRAPRIADATAPAEPLAGAITTVLAASNSDGSQLFVATEADGDICLIDQEPQSAMPGSSGDVRAGLMNVGCSPAVAAEQQGGVLTFPATATLPAVAAALVPNGVTHVDFVLADGTDVSVAVVNNVAWYSSPQLASVRFAVPGGQGVTAGTTPATPSSPGT